MKFLNSLSTSLSALLIIGVASAIAGPDGIIRNSVAICDPYDPTSCMRPSSDGSIIAGINLPNPLDVTIKPSSETSTSIVATSTTAAASSLTLINGNRGNLYGCQVTSGASAGYVMVFTDTSEPADGAVTPLKCYKIAANSTLVVDFRAGPPVQMIPGATIVFSTTGCFTKTASATAFISGDAY